MDHPLHRTRFHPNPCDHTISISFLYQATYDTPIRQGLAARAFTRLIKFDMQRAMGIINRFLLKKETQHEMIRQWGLQ